MSNGSIDQSLTKPHKISSKYNQPLTLVTRSYLLLGFVWKVNVRNTTKQNGVGVLLVICDEGSCNSWKVAAAVLPCSQTINLKPIHPVEYSGDLCMSTYMTKYCADIVS